MEQAFRLIDLGCSAHPPQYHVRYYQRAVTVAANISSRHRWKAKNNNTGDPRLGKIIQKVNASYCISGCSIQRHSLYGFEETFSALEPDLCVPYYILLCALKQSKSISSREVNIIFKEDLFYRTSYSILYCVGSACKGERCTPNTIVGYLLGSARVSKCTCFKYFRFILRASKSTINAADVRRCIKGMSMGC